jgi:transposase
VHPNQFSSNPKPSPGGGQSPVRRSRSLQVSRRHPWRDLPERFDDWKIVYQRFNRWAKSGVFERVFRLLASDHDNEYMMIDATIVRAH